MYTILTVTEKLVANLKRYFTLLVMLSIFGSGGISTTDITPYGVDSHYMDIEILDQKLLSYSDISHQHFSEISDLAYDKKSKKLYMLSDQGILFGYAITLDDKIRELTPQSAVRLRNKGGREFKRWRRDSEGMTIGYKGRLYISFEGRAKIGYFGRDGIMKKRYPLPPKLKNPKNYRSRNKSLEALAWHPKYGLLTATEWPLKRYRAKDQIIYSLYGREWHFKAESATSSAVVAMEVMDRDHILILERAYSGMMHPVIITLKKVWLNQCRGSAKKRYDCKSRVLAQFDSSKGWHIDNFEGLTKVSKDRYLMVSDDNDNFYQRTLLIYFRVIND
ncbi:Bll0177 protein [hydrothermal vent metagenome]|uniref:Bll0177 protein n=1 Tax=hydrothermal vent metagenome TaxID=652676 RepID=A0A1W1BGP1_9ZZZZ